MIRVSAESFRVVQAPAAEFEKGSSLIQLA